MAKFKVGDRVKVRSWESMAKEFGTDGGNIQVPCVFVPKMRKYCGQIVTIRYVSSTGRYLIKEDNGYGWAFSDEMFEPGVIGKTKHSPTKTPSTASNRIAIYADGKRVVAVDKATSKIGIARCHPDDEFDFFLGAEIALERLKENCKEPEYYSGEIVCTKAVGRGLTVGKIYTVKDGKFIDDEGDTHGRIYPYTSFKDLVDQHWSKFIEVVR
jgi:hypothetical protein